MGGDLSPGDLVVLCEGAPTCRLLWRVHPNFYVAGDDTNPAGYVYVRNASLVIAVRGTACLVLCSEHTLGWKNCEFFVRVE
jgi:hypothetical protein